MDYNEIRQNLGGKELTQENVAAYQQQKMQEEQMKEEIISQICTPEACDRMKRVALVKPEVAKQVRDSLFQMARLGKLASKVGDDEMMNMLQKAGDSMVSKVTIQRKSYFDDDSDDNDDDLL